MPNLIEFHNLVKAGNLEAVRAALAENPGLLNEANATGQTAFLLAKYYRQPAVADYLLAQNPQLDAFSLAVAGRSNDLAAALDRKPELLKAYNGDGWTVLHLAAYFGYPDLVALLLDRGASIEARSTNPSRNTPLHAAAAGGNVGGVKVLLQRGAKPNASQEGGWTALHAAAQNGNLAMVEALLANGADSNVRADNNQSPLDLALIRGHQETAALLEALGAKLQ